MHWRERPAVVEGCSDGWPGSRGGLAGSGVAALLSPQWSRGGVVGVAGVAGRAAARREVARVIVGTEEVERGVEEAGLVERDEDGVGAVFGAESTDAEAGAGPAGLLGPLRDAGLGPEPPAR